MGSYFVKSKPIIINNPDLTRTLLSPLDIINRLNYLEDKLDDLDAKLWSFESKTNASFLVLHSDLDGIKKIDLRL